MVMYCKRVFRSSTLHGLRGRRLHDLRGRRLGERDFSGRSRGTLRSNVATNLNSGLIIYFLFYFYNSKIYLNITLTDSFKIQNLILLIKSIIDVNEACNKPKL